MNKKSKLPEGVMLNAYPDSCGGSLSEMVKMLSRDELEGVFSQLYLLPSVFCSDLDRGFSVISYDLDESLASSSDLESLKKLNIGLKADFVLNHLSVQSPMFQDILIRGDDSPYLDTFIDWNRFWKGKGKTCDRGYIIPDKKYRDKLFMRKPELPILKIPFPDGTYRFYWNTFYQSVKYELPSAAALKISCRCSDEEALQIRDILERALSERTDPEDINWGDYSGFQSDILSCLYKDYTSYLGQMDLNGESETVWDFYEQTLARLKSYGASIVRLDAFAYLHKEAGKSNFFNEPGTWDFLERLKVMADKHDLVLLPEIHAPYEDRLHERIAKRGYPIYDFFFPGLVFNAIESSDPSKLAVWINEIREKRLRTVNMLGCHDGIPVLDVKGCLELETIDAMIKIIKGRGGRLKDLFGPDGKKISYYQINATFFSAFGESEKKMLFARALQMFMPGVPEIWYLDLFAGTNDYEAADRLGHKDINRTNLTAGDIDAALKKEVVQEQLKLLKFRNSFRAFGFESDMNLVITEGNILSITWSGKASTATLKADFDSLEYEIIYSENGKPEQVL